VAQSQPKTGDKSRISGSSIRGDHLNVPTGIGNNMGRDGYQNYNNNGNEDHGQDIYGNKTAGRLGKARKSEIESQGLTEIGGGN
jgi:hypothetical protein